MQKIKVKIYKPFLKNGGSIPTYPESSIKTATAEVEGGESAIIGNELVKFEGDKHSNGGIPVNLPNGSRIYSEFLKVKPDIVEQVIGKKTNKKFSYSDLAKKFGTSKYIDILDNPKSDDYQKTSAQIKLANNLGKLDTIFFAQEKEKESKSNDKFQYGGIKKYQMAGKVNPTFEDYIFGRVQPMDYQQLSDYPYDYPKVHTEPSPTVTTGVVLNLRNDKPIQTINLPEVEIVDESTNKSVPQISNRRTKSRPKTKSNITQPNAPTPTPEVPQSDLWQTPLPLEVLPQRNVPVVSIGNQTTEVVPNPEQVADIIIGEDDKHYPGTPKRDFKFGISPELAGTIADIGLALGDKLRVSEPTYYNRQKTPLFTRFVDFDDKEVQRMYDKNIQQIQQSNMPESVKQAQINELTSKYQDYQAKVDFGNLQRYEAKRERDTEKLQKYVDYNVDQRVADLDNYRQRKARVDELRDMFNAQRKSRIVNSLKSYADYADQISKTNEFTPNYKVNPISGVVRFKENQKSDLTSNLLQAYQKRADNKVSLPNGATLTMLSEETGVVTDANGKVEIVKLK